MTIEAYGPEGSAIIIQAISDNTNRTIAEVKKILSDHDAKFATPGSVLWAFNAPKEGNPPTGGWESKFPQKISDESKIKLEKLIEDLDEHGDVQDIFTNIL
jgi:transcriptional/translational regulatory protein YebC/TACO1